ncbi:MAG TPA: cation diffusion facilitator family transporter [Acidimicrobiia bacterium]|jgi:cation diffusion facilitator family transporter
MSENDGGDRTEEGASNGLLHRFAHLLSHDHDRASALLVTDAGAEGIRATKVSLAGLGLTALLQALIVVLSGSVALASDTIHNLGDALTAIPLWVAFSLGRRRPTHSYTYGYHRAEDVAGVIVVFAIGASAVLVMWESMQRLFEPRLIEYIPWVIAAGLIGAVGNELVARFRIRVGRRIGSEALVADGQHAHTDALTSLTVVAAGIGAAFGAAWVDPIAGLLVALVILRLLGRSARSITRRLLDAVDPELFDTTESVIGGVYGVLAVTDLKIRWHGHQLHVSAAIAVDPNLTVAAGHETAHEVEHAIHHAFTFPVVTVIHVDPEGPSTAHDAIAHHRP